MCGGGSKKSSAPAALPPGPTGPGYKMGRHGIRDAGGSGQGAPISSGQDPLTKPSDTITSFGSELGGA